jgi:hypothetical protein
MERALASILNTYDNVFKGDGVIVGAKGERMFVFSDTGELINLLYTLEDTSQLTEIEIVKNTDYRYAFECIGDSGNAKIGTTQLRWYRTVDGDWAGLDNGFRVVHICNTGKGKDTLVIGVRVQKKSIQLNFGAKKTRERRQKRKLIQVFYSVNGELVHKIEMGIRAGLEICFDNTEVMEYDKAVILSISDIEGGEGGETSKLVLANIESGEYKIPDKIVEAVGGYGNERFPETEVLQKVK